MRTAGEVARAALADLNCEAAGVANALRWVGDRYEEIAQRRLKQLRKVGELAVPAIVSAGTVTVARGSDAVIGNAAASTAWDATPGVLGWFLQAGVRWYEISSRDTTDLRLTTPYAEDSGSAVGYRLVKRYHACDPRARFLGDFGLERRRWRLEKRSSAWLDALAPDRRFTSYGPVVVSEVGTNPTDGARLVELYGYSTVSEVIRYIYWEAPGKFDDEDVLPIAILAQSLKEGVLVDVMRWKMAKAENDGKMDAAAFWRNEYRAQETRWRGDVIPQLIKADSGIEDMQLLFPSACEPGDIRTARDEVWSR